MQDLDKAAMGKRVRQIRLEAGLRQWELARMLGTTQSAVHKYEHGVVPEPRRLIELARIGATSLEWILTGQHWENGSESQQRPTPDLLETACRLREVSEDQRAAVDQSLRILRAAVQALGEDGPEIDSAPESEALELLEVARRVQRAVLRQVADDVTQRLRSFLGGSTKTRAQGA